MEKARKLVDNDCVNKILEFYLAFSLHLTRLLNILAFCYCKKQIDVSFLCVCPLIDDKFRHNIVKVCCRSTRLRLVDLQHFDNVMTKFIINKRTDA